MSIHYIVISLNIYIDAKDVVDDMTERWVQCSLCQKWRCVGDQLQVRMDVPWQCRYNLFNPAYNQCAAVQEPMPDEDTTTGDATLPDE